MTTEVALGLSGFLAQKIRDAKVEPDPEHQFGFRIVHKGSVRADDLRVWTAEYFKTKNEDLELDKDLMAHTKIDNRRVILSMTNLERINQVTGAFI